MTGLRRGVRLLNRENRLAGMDDDGDGGAEVIRLALLDSRCKLTSGRLLVVLDCALGVRRIELQAQAYEAQRKARVT